MFSEESASERRRHPESHDFPRALMRATLVRFLLPCCFASGLLLTYAAGQTVTGSITGVVTDPSSAVVSGAKVSAENVATGVTTTAQTNESGAYTIRFLPVGTYTITVEAKGFSTQKTTPFSLEIDQTAKNNISLRIGVAES